MVQFLTNGFEVSAMLSSWHSILCPSLSNRQWLPQKGGDFLPTFEYVRFRFGLFSLGHGIGTMLVRTGGLPTLLNSTRSACIQSSELFLENYPMESTISTNDLKTKIDQQRITVVETLAPERYREAHIPGAVNIPPEQINELAPQLLPNKDAEIITYCTNMH
jgi:hypothetical protein